MEPLPAREADDKHHGALEAEPQPSISTFSQSVASRTSYLIIPDKVVAKTREECILPGRTSHWPATWLMFARLGHAFAILNVAPGRLPYGVSRLV